MNQRFFELSQQEWLLTNGMGGFASGTVAGCATRRYHSLLTVALDPPSGRRMSLLGGVDETVILEDGTEIPLATHLYEDGTIHPNGWVHLEKFEESTWTFRLPDGTELSRSYEMLYGSNAVRIQYRSDKTITLRICPLVCWKEIHSEMRRWEGFPYRSHDASDSVFSRWHFQATADAPTLEFRATGVWEEAGWWNERLLHRIEQERGFNAVEELYCPTVLTVTLKKDKQQMIRLGISPERRAALQTETPPEPVGKSARERHAWHKELIHFQNTAGKFIVQAPSGRQTILAGYPWFTDWGRDTFIALPGLCLTTGRIETARQIVRDFAPWVRNGRIPNRFPDNNDEPAYNNVDGTLWYLRAIGLCGLQTELASTIDAIIDAHLNGTVGDAIYSDETGLLRCGDSHTNLTWMDAKVNGIAITPRFDRPVEVQALWINALHVAGRDELATKALTTFLGRFVRADGLGLYDCLLPDGTPSNEIRPNQVIAAALIDLPDTVNRAILTTATEKLLTPYGLRTLSPDDPNYAPRYEGGPNQRDAIYHQGTVWPWLIGSFCDLYIKVHGPDADTEQFLTALREHQEKEYGLGGIAEVFDADPPHRPNGCPWQAWSLSEVVRSAR